MTVLQIVSASVGGFLILLLLFLVFWRRNLTDAEYTFARIVLALAAACLAVLITGFLNVTITGFIQAGAGFGVFVLVFLKPPAPLQRTHEWAELRQLWRELHDVNSEPGKVNKDDLVRAINALNETAAILDRDHSLMKGFQNDYGADYCLLFRKLSSTAYQLPSDGLARDQLKQSARRLADQLGCTQ